VCVCVCVCVCVYVCVSDPGLLLPVASALGGVTSLFIVGIVLFFLLKVDVVLWFRRTFPDLYASTGQWSPDLRVT